MQAKKNERSLHFGRAHPFLKLWLAMRSEIVRVCSSIIFQLQFRLLAYALVILSLQTETQYARFGLLRLGSKIQNFALKYATGTHSGNGLVSG